MENKEMESCMKQKKKGSVETKRYSKGNSEKRKRGIKILRRK